MNKCYICNTEFTKDELTQDIIYLISCEYNVHKKCFSKTSDDHFSGCEILSAIAIASIESNIKFKDLLKSTQFMSPQEKHAHNMRKKQFNISIKKQMTND